MRSEKILGVLGMSSSEWKTVKLIEIVDTQIDNRGRNPDKYLDYSDHPVIDNYLIKNQKYPDMSEVKRYINKDNFENFLRGYLKKDDVLITLVGNGIGNVTMAPSNKSVIVQNTIGLRTNKNASNTFLYYLLLFYQDEIKNFNRGTSQPSIKKTDLFNLAIQIPPLQEQKAIAHILSTLDDKIEVNNQINKTLENMAQAYFDDMFPNVAAGDTTIGEYITPKRGKNLLSKDAISGEVPVIAGGLSPATYHNVSNTQSPVITISASGANAGFVNLWTVPVWSSDSSFIDYGMTKDVYFWYVMLKKRQKEIYDSQTGSAQPHIYPKHITIMPTIKLNVDEINLYTKRVTPLFKKIANNLYEISKLQLIRDTLLPKLMSGEIRVPLDSEGDVS